MDTAGFSESFDATHARSFRTPSFRNEAGLCNQAETRCRRTPFTDREADQDRARRIKSDTPLRRDICVD